MGARVHPFGLRILMLGLFSILMISCKKDVEPSPSPEEETPPTPPSPSSLIAGDTTGMVVVHYDTVYYGGTGYGQVYHTIYLLHGPPNQRLFLTFTSTGSVGTGQRRRLTVSCEYSDIWLNGYFTTDTLRYQQDTLLQYNAIWTPPYLSEVIYTQGCSLNENAPYDSVATTFKPHLYSAQDEIDTLAYHNVTAFTDHLRWNWTTPSTYLNDSTRRTHRYDRLNDCFDLPIGETFYLAFSIQQNGSARKGWIALRLLSSWSVAVEYMAIEP